MVDAGPQEGYWAQVALGGATGAAGRHARSQAVRLSVMVSAGEQFAEVGFVAASLGNIAKRCSLTKGALYFHFETKHALAEAVIAEMLLRWSALSERVAGRKLDALHTVVAELDEVIGAWETDAILRGGIRLSRDFDADRAGVGAQFNFGEKAVRKHLLSAEAVGLLRPSVNPDHVARHIVAALAGHLSISPASAGSDDLRTRMAESWSILLPAIATDEWLMEYRSSAAAAATQLGSAR